MHINQGMPLIRSDSAETNRVFIASVQKKYLHIQSLFRHLESDDIKELIDIVVPEFEIVQGVLDIKTRGLAFFLTASSTAGDSAAEEFDNEDPVERRRMYNEIMKSMASSELERADLTKAIAFIGNASEDSTLAEHVDVFATPDQLDQFDATIKFMNHLKCQLGEFLRERFKVWDVW